MYLYEVVKRAVLEAGGSNLFHDEGIYFMNLSGSDVRVEPGLVPSNMFIRQLNVGVRREFRRVDPTTALGRIRRVEGIHIDSPTSPGDIEGVTPLIGVLVEDS
jgi:hypothetical protein